MGGLPRAGVNRSVRGLTLRYIGETGEESAKGLDLPRRAGRHAILLFDEADALFGRRSEVKDSHDRYANIEVSYLLKTTVSQQHPSPGDSALV